MQTKVSFEKERETKNKVRFAEKVEDGTTPVVGTLYVAREVVESLDSDNLVVTIEGE